MVSLSREERKDREQRARDSLTPTPRPWSAGLLEQRGLDRVRAQVGVHNAALHPTCMPVDRRRPDPEKSPELLLVTNMRVTWILARARVNGVQSRSSGWNADDCAMSPWRLIDDVAPAHDFRLGAANIGLQIIVGGTQLAPLRSRGLQTAAC